VNRKASAHAPAVSTGKDNPVAAANRYPPISDYALIGDCHSAALVSRTGSIDWCCLPRFDSGSTFGRLLDWDSAGHCSISPVGASETSREYLDDTLVLATTFRADAGEARVIDFFVIREPDAQAPAPLAHADVDREIVRVIEGVRGSVEFDIRVAPRFDYGQVRPWIRRHGHHLHSAIGGDDALIVWCEQELEKGPEHELSGRVQVSAGERVRLSLSYCRPELIDAEPPGDADPATLDSELERTLAWWRRFADAITLDGGRGGDEAAAKRSGLTLKALTHQPTGAIIAAPTTSLPEAVGGVRNWDYRYAWIRDSSFSSRAFAAVGCVDEADAFRGFIMRSAAGHADDLQVLYGVGGERRLDAATLDGLEGYRKSAPVRIGNAAAGQRQLDAYGELVNLSWRWHRRGHSPNDDDWRFLVSLIDHAAEQWSEPDSGLWEWPGEPQHFVHSKVLCWSALDRGLRLADECMRRAPVRRWKQARDEVRAAIERRGYDRKRGVFVQVFDRPELDAALLLLPTVEFVAWDDERMVRTIEAIRSELDAGEGLLYRYRRRDGIKDREGAFLCCSFWLAEGLARIGELDDARTVFDRALACANDLGLFGEEVDPETRETIGNFPQGLTHLAHIDAAVALSESES
jgi:GH15 family glucan-1,4-alpha-glucosidase